MSRLPSLALACFVTACQLPSSGGSADGGVEAGANDFAVQLCARLDACMIATGGCVATYGALVYGTSCQSALLTASCSDLSAASPTGALAACYPPCGAPGATSCSGSTYTECTASGIAQQWRCDGLCALKGKAYSGTCGESFEGQTGVAQCWCK